MHLTARRYDNGLTVRITLAEGRIAEVRPQPAAGPAPWVAPGFVDLQVNGYRGREFNDPALSVEQVRETIRSLEACGVTRLCPTLVTGGEADLARGLARLAAACEDPATAARVPGIHLEGPYLSPEDGPRGAHPREHCRPPCWDEFRRLQDAAGGRIRLLTLAPEYDGAPEFIRRAVESGVVVALGHTAAESRHIRAAVDAGARLSTHLGNGAHGMLRRHPNYLWDQLAEDRLTATLIADGVHLPPAVVKAFVRAKTPTRCILVSDLVGMGGMPPGRYRSPILGEVEVLEDGRLVVAGQRQFLAGAAQPLGVGLANVIHFTGMRLRTAVEMCTVRPAQVLGIEPGGLEVGAAADLILFDLAESPPDDSRQHGDGPAPPFEPRATLKAGEVVWGAIA